MRSSIKNGVDFEAMESTRQRELVEASAEKILSSHDIDAKLKFLQTTRKQILEVLDTTDRPDVLLDKQTRQRAIEEILNNRSSATQAETVVGNPRQTLNQAILRLAGIEEALSSQSNKESQFEAQYSPIREKSLNSYRKALQKLIASKSEGQGFELSDLIDFDAESKRIAQQIKKRCFISRS